MSSNPRQLLPPLLMMTALLIPLACDDAGGDADTDSDSDTDTGAEVLPFDPAGPGAAPDPMTWGPFAVGVRTVDLYDERRIDEETGEGRHLRTEIWYPALQQHRDGPFEVLEFKAEAEEFVLPEKVQIILDAEIPMPELHQVRGAEIDHTHGPYPVVFFSHGANGVRFQSPFFCTHLASHGYLVVAPDHVHNTIWDIFNDGFQGDQLVVSLAKRTKDIHFLLDTLEDWDREEGHWLQGLVDEDRIASSGHSAGGITSFALPCQDERYDAIVAHSPVISAGVGIGACDLSHYPVPTLTQGGNLDRTVAWCMQYCEYRSMLQGPQPKFLYELIDGGHFTFSDICKLDLVPIAEQLGLGDDARRILGDGCDPENVALDKAYPTINHYAAAFLNWQLRGSAGSRDYLVERAEAPFDVANFFEGDVPDLAPDGCEACEGF